MMNYKTIAGPGTAQYEIQRSQFITHTAPVQEEADAQAFIRSLKKQYYDARHNCSAYVLGAESRLQKSNDDGEPGGTAGMPILESIKKNGLTNIVIVVTRYFGGIKLGAGGLIRAYGHAAVLGIKASPQVEAVRFQKVRLTAGYAELGTLENLLHKQAIRIEDKAFSDQVTLTLLLEKETADEKIAGLIDATAARCPIEKLEETYREIPLTVSP